MVLEAVRALLSDLAESYPSLSGRDLAVAYVGAYSPSILLLVLESLADYPADLSVSRPSLVFLTRILPFFSEELCALGLVDILSSSLIATASMDHVIEVCDYLSATLEMLPTASARTTVLAVYRKSSLLIALQACHKGGEKTAPVPFSHRLLKILGEPHAPPSASPHAAPPTRAQAQSSANPAAPQSATKPASTPSAAKPQATSSSAPSAEGAFFGRRPPHLTLNDVPRYIPTTKPTREALDRAKRDLLIPGITINDAFPAMAVLKAYIITTPAIDDIGVVVALNHAYALFPGHGGSWNTIYPSVQHLAARDDPAALEFADIALRGIVQPQADLTISLLALHNLAAALESQVLTRALQERKEYLEAIVKAISAHEKMMRADPPFLACMVGFYSLMLRLDPSRTDRAIARIREVVHGSLTTLMGLDKAQNLGPFMDFLVRAVTWSGRKVTAILDTLDKQVLIATSEMKKLADAVNSAMDLHEQEIPILWSHVVELNCGTLERIFRDVDFPLHVFEPIVVQQYLRAIPVGLLLLHENKRHLLSLLSAVTEVTGLNGRLVCRCFRDQHELLGTVGRLTPWDPTIKATIERIHRHCTAVCAQTPSEKDVATIRSLLLDKSATVAILAMRLHLALDVINSSTSPKAIGDVTVAVISALGNLAGRARGMPTPSQEITEAVSTGLPIIAAAIIRTRDYHLTRIRLSVEDMKALRSCGDLFAPLDEKAAIAYLCVVGALSEQSVELQVPTVGYLTPLCAPLCKFTHPVLFKTGLDVISGHMYKQWYSDGPVVVPRDEERAFFDLALAMCTRFAPGKEDASTLLIILSCLGKADQKWVRMLIDKGKVALLLEHISFVGLRTEPGRDSDIALWSAGRLLRLLAQACELGEAAFSILRLVRVLCNHNYNCDNILMYLGDTIDLLFPLLTEYDYRRAAELQFGPVYMKLLGQASRDAHLCAVYFILIVFWGKHQANVDEFERIGGPEALHKLLGRPPSDPTFTFRVVLAFMTWASMSAKGTLFVLSTRVLKECVSIIDRDLKANLALFGLLCRLLASAPPRAEPTGITIPEIARVYKRAKSDPITVHVQREIPTLMAAAEAFLGL